VKRGWHRAALSIIFYSRPAILCNAGDFIRYILIFVIAVFLQYSVLSKNLNILDKITSFYVHKIYIEACLLHNGIWIVGILNIKS